MKQSEAKDPHFFHLKYQKAEQSYHKTDIIAAHSEFSAIGMG